MKKIYVSVLLLLLLAVLAGCAAQQPVPTVTSAYQIYRLNAGETKLVEEGYDPKATKTEDLIGEMIAKLMENPDGSEMKTVFPEGVQITGATIQKNDLVIELGAAYKNMDNVAEALCRAGVVKTLVQIPGVDSVAFKVEGQDLADAQGEAIGKMNADTFLDSRGEGINPYQYATLVLYFPDESGEKIVMEMRDVYYSTNNTLEKVIVEQVLKGPVNTKLQTAVSKNVKIVSVTTQEGICTINFDASFNQKQEGSNVIPQATIYSIVNALCSSAEVKKVQIQIESDSNVKYLDQVDLSQPFTKNQDIIYQTDKNGETESEVKKPSVGIDQIVPKK